MLLINLLRRGGRSYDLTLWDTIMIIIMLVFLIAFLITIICCLIAKLG